MMLKVECVRPKSRSASAVILISSVVVVLGGCASFKAATPEEIVRERATKRWAALISGDFQKVYELTTPSYRSVSNFSSYKSKFGHAVNLLSADVVSVTCETEKCTSVVRVEAKPLLGGGFGNTLKTHVDETWLFEDGHWWFFQKL